MTKYSINIKVKVADSLNIKVVPVKDILKSTIDSIIDSTPKLSNVSVNVNVRLTEVNDNDMLVITGTASDKEVYSDITVRALRRLLIDSVNTLCSNYLESVVYEITLLDVIKA